MNAGIYGLASEEGLMPYPLLGRPTPVPLVDDAGHPEAIDWRNRVRINGGDVSPQTFAAVNQFCFDIEAAGLRDRFYRLNLFCGTNLSACIVPLYRATGFSLPSLGNATDTNNNFVGADYVERGVVLGGLKGNGSNKDLNTGLVLVSIGAALDDAHLAAYVSGREASGSTRVLVGDGSSLLGWGNSGSAEQFAIGPTGNDRAQSTTPFTGGLLGGTSSTARLQQYYRNGMPVGTTATATGSLGTNAMRILSFSGNFYSLARYVRAYSIGRSLSATQWLLYDRAMQRFQAALDRTA